MNESERLVELEKRVGALEVAMRKRQWFEERVWPAHVPESDGPIDAPPACKACGMQFDVGPLGYCCQRSDCPSGLGSVTCGGAQ